MATAKATQAAYTNAFAAAYSQKAVKTPVAKKPTKKPT